MSVTNATIASLPSLLTTILHGFVHPSKKSPVPSMRHRPAMGAKRDRTYWGLDFNEDILDHVKSLLGKDDTLDIPATNGKETEARELATIILDDPDNEHLNARQRMQRHKEASGTGIDLTFPDVGTIEDFERNLCQMGRGSLAPNSISIHAKPNLRTVEELWRNCWPNTKLHSMQNCLMGFTTSHCPSGACTPRTVAACSAKP